MLSAVGHSLTCVCWMVVVASRFEASSLGCLTASGSFSLSLSLFPPSLLLFCSLRLLLFLFQFLATVASASLPLCTELYFLPWGKKSKEDWDCRGGREVWRSWEETREDGMDVTLHSAADWHCPAEGKETLLHSGSLSLDGCCSSLLCRGDTRWNWTHRSPRGPPARRAASGARVHRSEISSCQGGRTLSSPDGAGRELAPVPFMSERLWGFARCVPSVLTRWIFMYFSRSPRWLHTHSDIMAAVVFIIPLLTF